MPTTPSWHRLPSLPGRNPAGNDIVALSTVGAFDIDEHPTRRSNHATPLLPQQVQSTVPLCAQPCLSDYITQEYTCASDDFSCLCSQSSSQGYTLGELAFTCLQVDCAHPSQDEGIDLYNICSAQNSAVSATHSTLTLPATTLATTTAASGVTTTTVYATATSMSSLSHTTQAATMSSVAISTAATSTAATVGFSSAYSDTSSPSATATATMASSGSPTTLTAAQAVGISVAAFGVVAIIVLLVLLVACIRRRKFDKSINYRASYDFIDNAPAHLDHLHHSWSFKHDPEADNDLEKGDVDEKQRKSEWYHEQFPRAPEHSPELNARRSNSLDSRKSAESMRTLSQLLPERPEPLAPRPPPKRYSLPPSTPATIFEEYSKSPQSTSAEYQPLPEFPEPAKSLPVKDCSNAQNTAPVMRSVDAVRTPSLSLDIPRQAARSAHISAPMIYPLPPIPAEFNRDTYDRRNSTSSRAKSQASTTAGSLLNYYASPDAGQGSEFGTLPTPSEYEVRTRKAVPVGITVLKPPYSQRAVRHSAGSDTSFESTDPDEPTPPEEPEKQLSPVHEHSPIAAVRYPKIPRSSNQVIPRSPPARRSSGMMYNTVSGLPMIHPSQRPQRLSFDHCNAHTPKRPKSDDSSLSGSTLAVKRRGNGPAQERRLFIDTSHARLNSRDLHMVPTPPRSVDQSSEEEPSRRSEPHIPPPKLQGRVASGGDGFGLLHQSPTPYDHLSPEMKSPPPQFARNSIAPQIVTLKSPLWAPKLTPRRHGEDLFLEVGLASPMYTPKPEPLSVRR